MNFEEYSSSFEDDLFSEMRNRLGEKLKTFSSLQDQLAHYSPFYPRSNHLDNVRNFYDIAVSTGVKELMNRSDPHTPWIAEEISKAIKGDRIVDVGCCDGFFTVFYAVNNPHAQFKGVDLSETALHFARKRAERFGAGNIEWVLGDALNLATEGFFKESNTVLLQDVLYQFFGRDEQMEPKMMRLLNQSGGNITLLAQEGNFLDLKSPLICREGYSLDSHRQKKLFDRHNSCLVPYEIAVFRKLSNEKDNLLQTVQDIQEHP